jgi:hypothetical protein
MARFITSDKPVVMGPRLRGDDSNIGRAQILKSQILKH